MKKDWHVLVFGVIHLLGFPLIHTIIYGDFRGFIAYELIWMTLNIPSFFLTFALLLYEYFKDKTIPEFIYHTATITLTSTLFLVFLDANNDPRNIFPIFQEHPFILVTLGIISHIIALSIFKFTTKILS